MRNGDLCLVRVVRHMITSWPRRAFVDGVRLAGRPIAEQVLHEAAKHLPIDAACDALLVAGKAGVLEHDLAATVRAQAVVPLTPVPVTARALAVLGRAGVVVVPDFLSTAAPMLAAVDPDGGDPMLRVHDAVADLAGEGTNLWMAAVAKAEQHLLAWQEQLPFGRPLS